jgi:D-arabinose 1-dehydrogenase-like Zn-dependent alcohol dehydrogenase
VELGKLGAKLPLTLGHEIVGVVEALGPDAEGVEVGDARVAFPWIGCRQCRTCAREPEHYCLSPKFLGARVNGGYAEYVVVPHAKYLLEHDGIPTELACTYACAGLTAYGALKKLMPLEDDEYLLTIGAGGVGLSGVHIAPALTEAKLVVADVDPEKRAVARQAGAHETVDNSEPDAAAKVKELSGGGIKAAIDFVGAPTTAQFALDAMRKGGTSARSASAAPTSARSMSCARSSRSAARARCRRSPSMCARWMPRPRRWPICAPATSAAA